MNKLNVENYLRNLIMNNKKQIGFHSYNTLLNEESKEEDYILEELSKLYESKLISYPRVINKTECEVPFYYIEKKEMYINYIVENFELGEFKSLININKKTEYFKRRLHVLHHGLICVGFKNEIKELGLYEKIMLRYLLQFIPNQLEYTKIVKIRKF